MRVLLSALMLAGLMIPAGAKDFTAKMPCDVYLEGHRAGIFPYVDDPILAYAETKKIIGLGYICTIADYVTAICLSRPDYSIRQALDEVDARYQASALPPPPSCNGGGLHLPSLPFLH